MKLTKKMIKEAKEYIVMIDEKASYETGLKFKTLEAKNILEAMAEAESLFDERTYLIRIAEKTETVDESANGIIYKEILSTRSGYNWNTTDERRGETANNIAHNIEFDFFQLV